MGEPCFQPLHEGHRNRGIALLAEQQRHVDVNAIFDQLADGRDTRLGTGHFDHQVGTVDLSPQPLCFRDRLLGALSEIGGDLETDVAVRPVQPLIDRLQRVGRVLDVLNRERLIGLGDARAGPALEKSQELRVVGIAMRDRLLEDGRIGGHAGDAVFLDEPLQPTFLEEAAVDKVQPGGLAKIVQLPDPARHRHASCKIIERAASTTWSTVKPNFSWSLASGADAPNVDIVIVRPRAPT